MDHHWLAAEFRAVVAALVGPLDSPGMAGFRVTHVEAGGNARIAFEGVPEAPDPGPGFRRPDRPLIVQAAAWTLERRARRFAARETFGEGDKDYIDEIRRRHPGRFECEVSPDPGWADLLFEMASRVESLEPGPDFAFTQVKEKFGTLRAYATVTCRGVDPSRGPGAVTGAVRGVGDIVDAFESVSAAICENCGGPGTLRKSRPGNWFHVACDEHARGPKAGYGD